MGPAIKKKAKTPSPKAGDGEALPVADKSDAPKARVAPAAREDKSDAPKARRDIASGEAGDRETMVRFVISPDGVVVPDLEGKLPGRGLWLAANRDVLQGVRLAPLFSRAAREKVSVPDDLADRLEALLASRCQNLMGLARRASMMVAGYEQVRSALRAGRAAVLIAASDGAADGRDKVRHLAPDLPLIDCLTSAEIGASVGAGAMVHAALSDGRLAREILITADKLGGLRRGPAAKAPTV
ncbi:MAG: RNA-binding protein [Alphaproteobacteria bacterium]